MLPELCAGLSPGCSARWLHLSSWSCPLASSPGPCRTHHRTLRCPDSPDPSLDGRPRSPALPFHGEGNRRATAHGFHGRAGCEAASSSHVQQRFGLRPRKEMRILQGASRALSAAGLRVSLPLVKRPWNFTCCLSSSPPYRHLPVTPRTPVGDLLRQPCKRPCGALLPASPQGNPAGPLGTSVELCCHPGRWRDHTGSHLHPWAALLSPGRHKSPSRARTWPCGARLLPRP